MELEAFRNRPETNHVAHGNLELHMELKRAIFDASAKFHAKYHQLNIPCILRLENKSEQMFFDWLTTTKYDAYSLHGDHVEKFNPLDERYRKRHSVIQFIPKGATTEDIERAFCQKLI